MSSPSKGDGVVAEDVVVPFTTEEVNWVRLIWGALAKSEPSPTSAGIPTTGMTKLIEAFYPPFLECNPLGHLLFEKEGFIVQGRSLVRMMAIVVSNVGDLKKLKGVMSSLGGRHEIYGVRSEDYKTFISVLVDSISTVLGPQRFPLEAKYAWGKVMSSVAAMMHESGRRIRLEGLRQLILVKIREDGEWKKRTVMLSLSEICLYRDEACTKLLRAFDFVNIIDLSSDKASDEMDLPIDHAYAIVIKFLLPKVSTLSFAVSNKSTSEEWYRELQWRSEAALRIAK
jgi:hemoglobin-like flavoprotein